MAKYVSSPGTDIPRTADVIIIGGGPAGTAALWAIERAAPGTKTVLLERSETLGAGSTVASLESYRSCWPTLCIAQQMTRSIEVFHNADEYLGDEAQQALSVRRHGYLFCGFNPRQAESLKREWTISIVLVYPTLGSWIAMRSHIASPGWAPQSWRPSMIPRRDHLTPMD